MAEYSTALRWESITRDKVKARIYHAVRDDKNYPQRKSRYNQSKIVPEMLEHNRTFIPIERDGKEAYALIGGQYAIDHAVKVVEERLALAKHYRKQPDGSYTPVALRKDASVLMETILQLDPEFTGQSWSLFEETFEDGAKRYLAEEQQFAESVRAGNYDAEVPDGMKESVAQIIESNAVAQVKNWRETISQRQELSLIHISEPTRRS